MKNIAKVSIFCKPTKFFYISPPLTAISTQANLTKTSSITTYNNRNRQPYYTYCQYFKEK